MVLTDGTRTIANGAGDALLSTTIEGGHAGSLDVLGTKQHEVDALSLGASRALAIFADGLEEQRDKGKTLTFEDIIAALREVSEEAARGL